MLEQVRSTKLGATCYTIIRKILLNIPHNMRNIILCGSSSPGSSAGGPKTPSDGHNEHHGTTTFFSGFPATDMNGTFSTAMSAELGPPSNGVSMSETANLNYLANMDLGALTQIWDWGLPRVWSLGIVTSVFFSSQSCFSRLITISSCINFLAITVVCSYATTSFSVHSATDGVLLYFVHKARD